MHPEGSWEEFRTPEERARMEPQEPQGTNGTAGTSGK